MDAVTQANQEAWEAASREHVRENDDLLAQVASGASLNAAERDLLAGILDGGLSRSWCGDSQGDRYHPRPPGAAARAARGRP